MKKIKFFFLLIAVIFIIYLMLIKQEDKKIIIGSKRFTESYILGEILTEIAEKVDEARVDYRQGLGNTGIVYTALKEGLIDIYPEYTATIAYEILKQPSLASATPKELNLYLNPIGLAVSNSLGFNNNYDLAMLESRANELGIHTISDLASHPTLRLFFSPEFFGRSDGWEGLKKSHYRFPQENIKTIDHSLSYDALAQGKIDVTDIYITDPKIAKYNLRILVDDRHFFSSYNGVLFYRLQAAKDFPKTWKAFEKLVNNISNQEIMDLNEQAEIEGKNFADIAQSFFDKTPRASETDPIRNWWTQLIAPDLWILTQQHLFLVFGALIPGIFIGIALGVITNYFIPARHLILNVVGVIQTIPSLALLAFLIPIFEEIGTTPALVALFLYSLLPIVRNTYAGLANISSSLRDASLASGIPFLYRLYLIEIPLASPMILAGIKTAAIINVGMATIAALIGAGGYGIRIVEGLALNDYAMLLSGAIPSCLMAICFQISFDFFDRYIIPRGLRK